MAPSYYAWIIIWTNTYLILKSLGHNILVNSCINIQTHAILIHSWITSFNSLAPGKFEWNIWSLIFQITSVTDGWGISCELNLSLSEVSHTTWGTRVIAQSLKPRQQNGPWLEILQATINTCLIINILSLWLIKKKKICCSTNYVTYLKMIILIYIPWRAL